MERTERIVTCINCGKEKRVHAGEFIRDHDNVIFDPHYLPHYQGWCLRCTRDDLSIRLKKALIEMREEKGQPIPKWLMEF